MEKCSERIFSGVYPTGIVYADRWNDRGGDYKRLAFLSFGKLELMIEDDCPVLLADIIRSDASSIQSMVGQSYRISTCGQTVRLGHQLEKETLYGC